MEIQDLSWNEHLAKWRNSPLLPRSIRGVIIGKSGCGKTTVQVNLLMRPGWLDYNSLRVFFFKSLFQPAYRIIQTAFKQKLHKELIIQLFCMRDEITDSNIEPTCVSEEVGKDLSLKSDIQC
jgi:hypothetical protein